LKVLLVHTYYQIKGGEDSVFTQETELLKTEHTVRALSFQNKTGWKGALQFIFSIYNIYAGFKLRRAIKEFAPDVIHFHNLHFAIGPIAILIAKRHNIPVVLTLHNYRLLCPSAILQYNGSLFTDSLRSAFPWTAINLKVYRNSKFQTFWLAFVIFFHKKLGTWKKVDRYIALTEFSKDLFAKSSFELSDNQICTKPNFVESSNNIKKQREGHFLFVGRLMEEKGIDILLNAFKNSQYKLQIAGSGPLLTEVLQFCKSNNNVTFLGNLSKSEVLDAMSRCTALIFPSTWFEGMPMTILESFSLGTPIIASKIGAMETMIIDGYNGIHFETGSSQALLSAVIRWNSVTTLEQSDYRKNATESYMQNYTPSANLIQLNKIYQSIN